MTSDLKLIIADVKAGRGTVGKLLRDDQVIDQVSATLSGVQKIVNKVDSIRTELSMFTAVDTRSSNQSDLSLAIYPSPERFYLLGISTSEVGIKDEREIRQNSNGGPMQIEHRTEIKKNTFLFNIQIGRRK
jgi:phospholipid/cholesterol/gamma-HCH transport system substrate-binding protein